MSGSHCHDGLALSCIIVGALCLVGALAAAVSLPGNRYDPLAESSLDDSETVGSTSS